MEYHQNKKVLSNIIVWLLYPPPSRIKSLLRLFWDCSKFIKSIKQPDNFNSKGIGEREIV